MGPRMCERRWTEWASFDVYPSAKDCPFPVGKGKEFMARREIIVEGLNSIPGFSCVMPHGAFYAFPNITKTGYKSKELRPSFI